MRENLATELLSLLGPGRVLHDGAANAAVLSELLLAGCDAWATGDRAAAHPRWLPPGQARPDPLPLDTLLLDLLPGGDFVGRLRAAVRLHGVPGVLALRAPGHGRAAIEALLIAAGWRRHPGWLSEDLYPVLRDDVLGAIALYQPLPAATAARWPAAALPRGPGADMLRATGGRADAHLARYAWAVRYVRAGDTVLDAACGHGSGTAVLAARSRGGRFLGLDRDPGLAEYAQANYGGADIAFAQGGAADLPDASVDVVVAMGAVECAPDWHAALAEFRRVLRPDGRLVLGVPDAWVEPLSGADAAPARVLDWAVLSQALSRHFLLEARFAQAVPGGVRRPDVPRAFHHLPLEAGAACAEWLLAVGSVDPLQDGADRRGAFRHPAFGAAFETGGAGMLAFGRDYDNPYLYRSMVQLGERLQDEGQLIALASRAVAAARPGSADMGAAICVLGYRALETRAAGSARTVLDAIGGYLATPASNAHALRWHTSLSFLAGRLAAMCGDRPAAIEWFRRTSNGGWRGFSPILATKTVAAALHEGTLHLAAGDLAAAKACFERGVADALDAARGEARDIVGDPAAPVPFGLAELAEVLDIGSQCANALAALPLWDRDPGLFWRQLDQKRFGMLTWSLDLTRTNQNLARRNHELEIELGRATALATRLRAEAQAASGAAPRLLEPT